MNNLIVEFEHALKRIVELENQHADLCDRVRSLETTLYGEQPKKEPTSVFPPSGVVTRPVDHPFPYGNVHRPVPDHVHFFRAVESTNGTWYECTVCGARSNG